MNRLLRRTLRSAAVGAAIATLGCATEPDVPPRQAADDALVSDTRRAATLAVGGLSLHRGLLASTRMSTLALENEFVHIALAPGLVPDGLTASISNKRLEGEVSVTIRDGGFDPVPIAATAGDSVIVNVMLANGGIRSFRKGVPGRRRPTVVRTSLPRGKRGVPLNMHIRVVFSEPVDQATVDPSTVRVLRGRNPIPGVVRIVDGGGVVAAFIPSSPLEPNAEYRIEITTGVKDLQGDALERVTAETFTTGTSIAGPAASIRVSPDTVEMTSLTYQMAARVEDAEGNELTDEGIVWSASDGEGIEVTQSGLVTALAEGEYDVVARLGDLIASGRIRVQSEDPTASVAITPAPATVALEDTLLLSAVVRDEAGRQLNRQVTWSISDPTIATVEASGPGNRAAALITHRTGSVAITATSADASATSVVNVLPPRPVSSMTLTPDPLDILASVPTRVVPTLRDANGREVFARAISWTSEDPTVATVDASGIVAGLKAGSTTIVAHVEGVTARLPVVVSTLSFRSVVSGRAHGCALTEEGAAYCWGSIHHEFQPLISSTVPVAVPGGLRFESLVAGGTGTCGLLHDGSAHCWGNNEYGSLGNGSLAPSVTPVAVQGGHTFNALTAGADHVFGLTPQGAALCWGANFEGQLGIPITSCSIVSSLPVAVSGGHTFTSLFAGFRKTCGLTSTGAAYCWGGNGLGQLGNGSIQQSSAPTPVSGGLAFSSLASGSYGDHTCGLATDGAAYCWGNNFSGQLGDGLGTGTLRSSLVPVAVSSPGSFAALTVGAHYSCGITAGGEAYCWGSNAEGRLGIGSGGVGPFNPFDFRPGPVAVVGGISFAAITAGAVHTCGISTEMIVYCWGGGYEGQLGRGSKTHSNVPMKVGGQP